MTTPKKITLEEWVLATYGDKRPSILTVRRWCREGRIWPAPEKHGRAYYVRTDARYINPANPPRDLVIPEDYRRRRRRNRLI